MLHALRSSVLLLALFSASPLMAGTLNVAVASNFAGTLHTLVERFEQRSGHQVKVSSASTGKLYTQIKNGAPFDVFMSADEIRADMLVKEGNADASRAVVYAQGKLVFISNLASEGECRDVLSDGRLKRLAIANPRTAPYGAAAQEVMEQLGVWSKLRPKLVMGENIAQTLQFVATTSANAGFVAKSMLLGDVKIARACEWDVPSDMYSPISQKMVVLKQVKDIAAVNAFWEFMRSPEAAVIIRDSGYDVP